MAARIQTETAVSNEPVVTDSPSITEGSTNQNPSETVQAHSVVDSEVEQPTSSDEVPAQDDEAKIELSDADKMKHAFEKRLGKLTSKKKELTEQSSAQMDRIAELERKLAEVTGESDSPDVDDMTEQEYIAYQVKQQQQELMDNQRSQYQEQQSKLEAAQAVQKDWNSKIEAFGKDDFVDVVSVAQEYIPDDIKQLVVGSNIGPKLLYTIAKDVDMLERLTNLDSDRRRFEVYSLEQRLLNPVSQAKPTPNVKGAAPSVKPFDPQTANMDEFLANRNKRKNRNIAPR